MRLRIEVLFTLASPPLMIAAQEKTRQRTASETQSHIFLETNTLSSYEVASSGGQSKYFKLRHPHLAHCLRDLPPPSPRRALVHHVR
jgi:hypothetical protein